MHGQLNIYDIMRPEYRTDRPVRLVELFAGIGSQAMALRDLGADFERYRVIENDRFAVASYNAIHGTDFVPADIREVSGADLGITDTDRYCYIMTYSFPCQDLSVCGRLKGMKKGGGTRSGLLWEVERLLNGTACLPQVLLMENVPQVHSKRNMPDFHEWIGFLEGKGYSNYWQDLNAKDYGIAQNRNRCFMVSILGEWAYRFPEPVPLEKEIGAYLEDDVDGRFYIDTDRSRKLVRELAARGELDGGDHEMEGNFNQRGKVHGKDSVCRTVLGSHAGNEPKVLVDLSTKSPKKRETADCITCRENRSVSGRRRTGNGVAVREVLPLNVMADGTCRTIKGQYQKNSMRNFGNARYGATGAVVRTGCGREHRLGNLYGFSGGNYAGNVYGTDAPAPAVRTYQGGNQQPAIVQKDNMSAGPSYRIRKLTPLECWRLMGFSDEDFLSAKLGNRKAAGEILERYPHLGKRAYTEIQRIEKMSNTQLYKQAGNSIVKNVLMAVFAQIMGGDRG